MKQRTVRDELQEYYRERDLPSGELERLLLMTETSDNRPLSRSPTVKVLVFAALVLIAFGATLLWLLHDPRAEERQETALIAEEIAMNHAKGLAVEYATGDPDTLGRYMDKLDFPLVVSERMRQEGWRLVGGRYCSIQGQLAAQLQFEDEDGQRITLYQTQAFENRSIEAGVTLQEKGWQIDLWQEGGLFFGAARAP